MSKGARIIEGMKASIRTEDDVLYCKDKHADYIEDEFSISSRVGIASAQEMTVFGVTIQRMPDNFKRPILCQKGDVFPLAKDWKNGEYK